MPPAARARKTPPRADPAALADGLHSAAIHLLRRLRTRDAGTGLSAPRLSALSVIVFAGPISLSALAAAEQVRPPTMTRLVRALETRRLVTRRRDPGDARRTLLAATPRGRALLASGRARRLTALTHALQSLPPRDLAALRRALPALHRALSRIPLNPDS